MGANGNVRLPEKGDGVVLRADASGNNVFPVWVNSVSKISTGLRSSPNQAPSWSFERFLQLIATDDKPTCSTECLDEIIVSNCCLYLSTAFRAALQCLPTIAGR